MSDYIIYLYMNIVKCIRNDVLRVLMNMRNKSLSFLTEVDPPEALSLRVLACIQAEKRRLARIRLYLFGTVSTFSFVALFPAFQYTLSEIASSGFYDYASLLISDTSSLLPYWKEFTLSLVETLPVFGIVLSLALIFLMLESLRTAIRNMNVMNYQIS